jgi:hypothetical protein
MGKITAAITAVQGYVPEHILSNEDLAKLVDTSDEWITSRTGIKERRIMKDGVNSVIVTAIPYCFCCLFLSTSCFHKDRKSCQASAKNLCSSLLIVSTDIG